MSPISRWPTRLPGGGTGQFQERIPIGGNDHRDATCRMFHDTFNPYRPAVIDRPELTGAALARLTGLPIWDIAVQTGGRARLRMRAYARCLTDPAWRDAIDSNASGRRTGISRCCPASSPPMASRLPTSPASREPRDAEWAYLVTGFSECIDSFFAFGLFEMAKRSGFFPPELVDTFEPVIQEEARHISLFAKWLAWHRRRLNRWRRAWFELRVAAVWVFLAWERIGLAGGIKAGSDPSVDNNFTLNGGKAVSDADLGLGSLMAVCLAEDDRRFAGYDSRLLRPTTVPGIARGSSG